MNQFEPPPKSTPSGSTPSGSSTTNPVRSEFQKAVVIRADNLARLGEDAICGLIDLTSQRLVRFATTITRNQHDAEDAVQATLIQVARQPKLLAGCDDPWAYLLRMVRNESLLIGRRKPRWRLIDGLCDLLTHRRVDEIELEERYREVWLALRKLPTQQSEVVVLKIWEDMTLADIADVLEITQSTAASRYRYAKQKLAQLLSSHQTEFTGVGHDE